MTAMHARYDRWKAPQEDGQALIWPAPDQLLRDCIENHQSLGHTWGVRVQNVPLPEVRRRMREWIGHQNDNSPIIATGHQAELHHPGVWVKNALIDSAAAKLGGRAIHFAVDTDQPKHLSLRWPGGSAPLTDQNAASAQWSGLLPSPSPSHVDRVARAFENAAKQWTFEPMAPRFLDSMRRLSMESPNLPAALTNALHELDWSLGLRHEAMLISPICLSEPYLVFTHHVLARAEKFAADYNAALDEYRLENRIRTPGRPMPNLKTDAEGVEVPFWLDDLPRGTRTRASVSRGNEGFILTLDSGQQFTFRADADGWAAAEELMLWLRANGVRLAPRALTLTAVLRLLLADQFVHGIGGGQYDQVLDRLIFRHLGLEPPRFSVTTATLYFPEAAGQPRVCLPCLAQQGHRLKHAALGNGKKELVEAIAASPRGSIERSALFSQMHQMLAQAQADEKIRAWEQAYRDAQHRSQEERTLFDRELFYAIQPRDRLSAMIERYRAKFQAG